MPLEPAVPEEFWLVLDELFEFDDVLEFDELLELELLELDELLPLLLFAVDEPGVLPTPKCVKV